MSDNSENRSSDNRSGDAPPADSLSHDPSTDQTFTGYDLESGVLQRVRRWRDAIPALVLIDALRVAGSPLYVGVIWIALSVASFLPPGFSIEFPVGSVPRFQVQWYSDFPGWPLVIAAGLIAIVTLPAALAARAGACYAAGRSQSFTANGRVTLACWSRLFVIPLVPVGITAGLSVVMMGAGAFGRIGGMGGEMGRWLVEATALAALPIAILIGMIAGGAVAAVPLAIAATVLEKQSDVLDSLSRGYEYLFRRPIYLAFYVVCAVVLSATVWQLAVMISGVAIAIGGWGLQIGAGDSNAPQGYRWLLVRLPLAVAVTAVWGQVGAIYLLMRQVANEQEIEDIAISPTDTQTIDMPTLKSEI